MLISKSDTHTQPIYLAQHARFWTENLPRGEDIAGEVKNNIIKKEPETQCLWLFLTIHLYYLLFAT